MKVSVVIATYNGEKYIKDQLDSILSQISTNDEIVISDDSSTDKTVELIKSYNDSRIILFEKLKFGNHIKNFEYALSKCSGDIIFLSDQDDIWLDNKVTVCLSILENADLVNSDCLVVDANENVIMSSYFKFIHSRPGFIKNLIKNSYVGCCMAFKKKVLDAALPFPSTINSHDTWIGLTGEMFFDTAFIEVPLIKLRRHGKNFSSHSVGDTFLMRGSPFPINVIIYSRFKLIYSLVKRFIYVKRNRWK